jgi:hypothetical protein
VDVVGHDNEGVEFIVAFAAVVLEGFEEEFSGGCDLEESSAVVGLGGDEEGSVAGCSGGMAMGHQRSGLSGAPLPTRLPADLCHQTRAGDVTNEAVIGLALRL